jgi:hypothetical protein
MMDIEKWIEENERFEKDFFGDSVAMIKVEDLRELLKTHTLVPNEPTEEMIDGFWGEITHGEEELEVAREAYHAMLSASKEQ